MKDDFISKIGVYGQMHYRYLRENKPSVVNVMRMKGTLRSYLEEVNADAENMLAQQQIVQLKDLLEESYRAQIQSASLNLTDYHFSGQETVQILNNLLKTRIDDLESSSVKDVVSLLKALSDQGALEMGDGGFSRHFVQIPAKFNILCPQCNREGYAVEGLDFRCEFCGCIAKWDESQRRYFPNLGHL